MLPAAPVPRHSCSSPLEPVRWSGRTACSVFPRELPPPSLPTVLSGECQLPKPKCPPLEGVSSFFLCVDPVSRKNVKSAHSTRNRYSSQWTLTKCQASTPARTLTSDWRTVGSQHGVTVTESDSYSASLSQDTGEPGALTVSCSLSFSSLIIQPHLPFSQLLPTSSWRPGHKSVSFMAGH